MLMFAICPETHHCALHRVLLWYGKEEGDTTRLRLLIFQRLVISSCSYFWRGRMEFLHQITFLCFFERDPTPKLAYNELPHRFSSGEVIGIFFNMWSHSNKGFHVNVKGWLLCDVDLRPQKKRMQMAPVWQLMAFSPRTKVCHILISKSFQIKRGVV